MASPSALFPAVFHFLGQVGFTGAQKKFGNQAKLLKDEQTARDVPPLCPLPLASIPLL